MLKRIIAGACWSILPLACAVEPSPELGEQGAQLGARDDERVVLRDGEMATPGGAEVAKLELPNGTVLHFVAFRGDNIGVLESQPANAASIASVAGLPASASAADVFYAFSPAGTALPSRLSAAAAPSPSRGARPQGWARAQLAETSLVTTGNCNDATFQGVVNGVGYNDRGTPDFRLNQSPGTSAFFDVDHNYAPGDGNSYTFYEYSVGGNAGSVWSDVDRYYSRVAVCAVDSYESENPGNAAHPAISYQGYVNNHMGPVVAISYRAPGETSWHTAVARDFAANEVGQTQSWHFFSGTNFDWMTRIYWAGAHDSFDIGHAVEDL